MGIMYSKNITLITSVINVSKNPLNYTNVRSYWTKEQRFEQTKKTIESVRKHIPDNLIVLVECSEISKEERDYFTNHTDYFLNLHDINSANIIERISSSSKAMGEGTMTIFGLEFLSKNQLQFDNLFKLSGRYWLNNSFRYPLYDNEYNMFRKITEDLTSVFTCLYKLKAEMAFKWLSYLKQSEREFQMGIGFENIFGSFLSRERNLSHLIMVKPIGINGYISVANEYFDI
jgi:hypothetical protein